MTKNYRASLCGWGLDSGRKPRRDQHISCKDGIPFNTYGIHMNKAKTKVLVN